MLDKEEKEVLKKLVEIDMQLPDGAALTFAVDNVVEMMDADERDHFCSGLESLITEGMLSVHTDKKTANGIPYWLELTNTGRKHAG